MSKQRTPLMPLEEAMTALLEGVAASQPIVHIPLTDSLGKVLAHDMLSPVDVPPADNSAMDGYCFNTADFVDGEAENIQISQRVPAGVAPTPLTPGTCARVFTGAEIPPGADAVVMQENCEAEGERVYVVGRLSAGSNIRKQGQDIRSGAVVVAKGQRIRPQEMGLLASVGIASVPVYKPMKVALLSTGDELVEPGQSLSAGQIYNSNRYTLLGLLQALQFDVLDLGIIADTPAATEAALLAASEADCIISSGGVSVGEEDHVKKAIEALGTLTLWKLAIKPGKPFAFGSVNGTPLLALPGNPVAAFATFLLLCRPYLLKAQGDKQLDAPSFSLPANFSHGKAGTRQEYLRGKAEIIDGEMRVSTYPNQSSGVLSSTSWGNGLVLVPIGETVSPGDLVSFLPYRELVF